MNEAFTTFISIVETCAPYSLAWALGMRAYRFLVNAFTGRDVQL